MYHSLSSLRIARNDFLLYLIGLGSSSSSLASSSALAFFTGLLSPALGVVVGLGVDSLDLPLLLLGVSSSSFDVEAAGVVVLLEERSPVLGVLASSLLDLDLGVSFDFVSLLLLDLCSVLESVLGVEEEEGLSGLEVCFELLLLVLEDDGLGVFCGEDCAESLLLDLAGDWEEGVRAATMSS